MICNLDTLLKAALGDKSGLDKMLDKLFYDYNDYSYTVICMGKWITARLAYCGSFAIMAES